MLAIPYVLAAELFPMKVLKVVSFSSSEFNEFKFDFQIRAACISIAISLMWIIIFVYETIFPAIISNIGLSGCMILFGTMCLSNAVFGLIFIPNTRGKSYEEIMQLLAR